MPRSGCDRHVSVFSTSLPERGENSNAFFHRPSREPCARTTQGYVVSDVDVIPVMRKNRILEFIVLASAGSHLAYPCLVAIGVIAVMEAGNDLAKSFLPSQLVRLYTHTTSTA